MQVAVDKTSWTRFLLLCFIYNCTNSTEEYAVAYYTMTLMNILAMYN